MKQEPCILTNNQKELQAHLAQLRDKAKPGMASHAEIFVEPIGEEII
ncbi:hypothetical protein MKY19_12780 [Paenibacillus sp. FSL R5-0744]